MKNTSMQMAGGLMFAQLQAFASWHTELYCYNCGKKGHIGRNCLQRKQSKDKEEKKNRSEKEEAVNVLNHDDDVEEDEHQGMGLMFYHHEGETINKNWIILETGSTVDVFCNPNLLDNIRTVNEKINIHCNA